MKKKIIFKATFSEQGKGSFSGFAMQTGIPKGNPYFDFKPEAVAAQVGTVAKLMLDHAQSQSHKVVGSAKFTGFDGKNLLFEAQLLMDASDVANEVYPRIKSGALDSVSVGVIFDEWEQSKESDVWVIAKFHIIEMSIVPFPAFEGAKIKSVFSANKELFETKGIKIDESLGLDELKKLSCREFEALLSNVGFSNAAVMKISSLSRPLLMDGQTQSDFVEIAAIENFLKDLTNKG